MKTLRLTVELVPSSCWEMNLRTKLPAKVWDRLRKEQYAIAGHVCQICGKKGTRHPVECHEVWHYDDASHVQKLTGLISLCPPCHAVKHIGYQRTLGSFYFERTVKHLAKVNDLSFEEAMAYVSNQFQLWAERSKVQWILDLSWLQSKDISVGMVLG